MLLSAKSKPLQITTAYLLEKFHYAPNMKIIHVHLSEYTPERGRKGVRRMNSASDRRFWTYRENDQRVNHKKTVYALLQQCIDQELTVQESIFVFNAAIGCINSAAQSSSLASLLTSSSVFSDKKAKL